MKLASGGFVVGSLKTSKPPLGWVMSDGPGCMERFARNPMLLPAQRTFIFQEEEERIDMETALLLHRHHRNAFSEFSDFASERMDPLAGFSREEFLGITHSTCPGLSAIGKSSWPWKNTDPGVTFDAGITLGVHANRIEKSIVVITMSARYPMIHLAWLWALQTRAIRLLPVFVIRQPMLIMGIDPEKSDGTQIEVIYSDRSSKINFGLLRSQHLQEQAQVIVAVPRTLDAWLASDVGKPVSHDWSQHALFSLARVDQKNVFRPVRDDDSVLRKLREMRLESSEMGTSDGSQQAA